MPRQFIHLSGILFVLLAQFIGSVVSIYFFMISFILIFWAWHIKSTIENSENVISRLEHGFRDAVMKLERKNVKIPFTGAIWFYIGCGIAFFIFPLHIASAACIILSVGDAFSTIVGKRFGRKRIFGVKTFEGSIAFFISSLFAALLFVSIDIAIIGCLTAMVTEMLLGHEKILKNPRTRWLNDNLLIPILAALVMFLV